MQPWSVISIEVVLLRTTLMSREASGAEEAVLPVDPEAADVVVARRRSASSSFGISSGGFWRSASRVTITWPRTRSNAAMIAMCWP